MEFDFYCPFCGEVTTLVLSEEQSAIVGAYLVAKEMGTAGLIQDELPFLSPQERELFITGMCPKCQSRFFESDED